MDDLRDRLMAGHELTANFNGLQYTVIDATPDFDHGRGLRCTLKPSGGGPLIYVNEYNPALMIEV